MGTIGIYSVHTFIAIDYSETSDLRSDACEITVTLNCGLPLYRGGELLSGSSRCVRSGISIIKFLSSISWKGIFSIIPETGDTDLTTIAGTESTESSVDVCFSAFSKVSIC